MAIVVGQDASVSAGENLVLGFHAHDPAHIDAAARTGYSAIRLWDTSTTWANLAPQRNLWDFDRISTYLTDSEKAHLKVLWTIGSTPHWASARPSEKCAYGLGCAAEPVNIDDWRRYVRTIATTFRGRVECYEPWNEVSFPHDPVFAQPGAGGDAGEFFTGSVDTMVALTKAAYEEIKRADPQACVLSPSFHSSGHWVEKFERFLDAGGGQYFDVASQHFYFGDLPEQSRAVIRSVRQALDKHNLQRIPIWNTEVGIPFSMKMNQWPGIPLQDVVYALTLRTYLVNVSEGINRIYWYAWDNGEFGFFDPLNRQDFGTEAASAANHVLDGFKSARCQDRDGIWQCRVDTVTRRFRVMWSSEKNAKPVLVSFDREATRWGQIQASFRAGTKIALDGRPVIVEEDNN